MIDPEVFRTSREVGRAKLAAEEARNSFGYWIDVPNDWESYSSPEDLILFLGIHLTHRQMFNEIIEDLGPLPAAECEWVERYVKFYERIARLLCTTGQRVDLKHDIAETLVDWRIIQSFKELPCKVLDFGAGCCRQGASAFLRSPDMIYTAIDATLAAYTLQNLVLSYFDTLEEKGSFYDFLDFEKSGRPLPDIARAFPGDRFHIPTWLAEANVPKDFYDVIIAAHVHNELSGPDFLRLVNCVDKSLARDGILYVRSELTIGDTRDYMDAVDLHGIALLDELHKRKIVPVWCRFISGYLTTVFARVDSREFKNAKKSGDPDNQFHHFSKSMHISAKAAENYLQRSAAALVEADCKTVIICSEDQYGGPFLKRLVKAAIKLPKTNAYSATLKSIEGLSETREYAAADILGPNQKRILNEIKAYDPQAIVIASQQYPAIEPLLSQAMPNRSFALRRYYWYPVVFLHRNSLSGADAVFNRPILSPEDLPKEAELLRS
ncbi:hypothetical protein LCGC14_0018180 [marine sediment metagenome]|uniref:Uncharacterized protein n=1 Tax=marine sediment metagenome TaxID=412755 RepID=A0A0F9YGI6_9ZZZZ|nr:hypothetical protein [Phycisphaerae bacterium]HDZ42908.1 hypothetical protein [Phycisphaerae bacterium]